MIRDFRFALRALRRSPGFTAVAVLLLSLGIGAATALFSVVKATLLEPWPYSGARRIVTIAASYPRSAQARSGAFSAEEAADLMRREDVFDAALAGTARDVNLTGGGAAERIHAVAMTASAFRLLGVPPAAGRVFDERDDRPGTASVVVLGNRLWRDRFHSDPSIVGRPITIEDASVTVLGVMPPRFLWWDAQLYFPLKLDAADPDPRRRFHVQGRLRSGVSPGAAEASLNALARTWERREGARRPEYAGMRFRVAPLLDDVLRDLRPVLWILLGASGLLLAVACANLGNLYLARASGRAREIAIRTALGAGTAAIARRFLAESAILGAAAAAGAALVARLSLRALLSLVPYGFIPAEADVRIDRTAFGLAVALGAAAAGWLGLLALLRTPRGTSALASRGESTRTSTSRLFVAVQAALAVVLVAGAASLAAGFREVLREPIGVRTADAATLRFAFSSSTAPDARRAASLDDRILAAAMEIPSVRSAGAVSQLPLSPSSSRRLRVEGASEDDRGIVFDADALFVAGDYFAAAGIPIRGGRPLGPGDDDAAPRAAVVNETLARRFWPGQNPIGRRLREKPGGPWRAVVGVVGDVRQSLDLPQRAQFYVPIAQSDDAVRTMALVLETGRPSETIALARRAIAAIDPGIAVYSARPMRQVVLDALGGRRLGLLLISFFAAAVLALSIAGVQGAAAVAASGRTREIGIRTALGSPRSAVVAILLRDAVGSAAAGGVIGAVAAAIGLAALGTVLPGARFSPVFAAASGAAVVVSALFAAWVPARRASRIDPMEALRAE